MFLGCIADDFTGATDLAGMLVAHGMSAVQTIGLPPADLAVEADAVVIALKSRTAPVADAVSQSLKALEWLRARGARQIYFKYCSTFDSTAQGNIGPVADALLNALDAPITVFCPALPVNGRSVYKGYLFVGECLLNESGMQDHPLTPMTDANLVRVLAAQTSSRVGLIERSVVAAGAEAIERQLSALAEQGVRMAVVDAVEDRDLMAIGRSCAGLGLVTGGSGLAIGLPQNFAQSGLLESPSKRPDDPVPQGGSVVIAGSCSSATRGQIAHMSAQRPAFQIDPLALAANPGGVDDEAVAWAIARLQTGPVLIYSSAEPAAVAAAQADLGVERAGALVEESLAAIACRLVDAGVRRLVIAGGETSGAVVKALAVQGLKIGAEIDPGVPWTTTLSASADRPTLALALKSGNFGTEDFFLKAFDRLG